MKNIKKILTIALIDSIASQFYMGYLFEEFRITLAVVIFPVLLYMYDGVNPIKASIVTGIAAFFSRTMFMILEGHKFYYGIEHSYQEIGFYIVYGLLYYFIYYRHNDKNITRWFITIWLCDFISNFTEVLLRIGLSNKGNILTILRALIGIAIIRAIISVFIIYFMKRYKLLIIKEEHDERYRKLVSLTEELKSETYFITKNLDYLENIMSNTYTLYEKIPNDGGFRELKNLSLNISKDVHEVKKEYLKVLIGIREITNNTVKYSDMNFKDIIDLLNESTVKYLKAEKIDIDLVFNIESNFKVKEHYALMSVLRNLINNSMESLLYKDGNKTIKLEQFEEENNYIFKIIDNGSGIKEKDIEYIFEPGFSTKFNREGEIKRGIGLTLVKSIVENDFNGIIEISSKYNKGTIFHISIPKSMMEGK